MQLPESIADHMYRMAICSLLLPSAAPAAAGEADSPASAAAAQPAAASDLPGHAAMLSLAHDIAEAIVGDIVPHDPMGREEKLRREREAMDKMKETLGDHPAGQRILDLWLEYEHQESEAAKYVKDIDRFEMILQALEYERDQPGLDLSDFYASTRGKFKSDTVKGWADEVVRRRETMIEARKSNLHPGIRVAAK